MDTYQRNRQRLVDIYRETIETINRGYYKTTEGNIVRLDDDSEMRENSRFYSKEFNGPANPNGNLKAFVEEFSGN